jgi:hypothetical protein
MTFHGIGTMLYGQRDYWPDGSFVTTEWAVLAWIPIFPTFSKRICYALTSRYSPFNPRTYYVLETTAPNVKQVLCVYGWFGSIIVLFVIYEKFLGVLTRILGDADRVAELWLLMLAAILVLPYAMRRLAKMRKKREWERAKLGLSPPMS